MKIKIDYLNKSYLATVVSDYTVTIDILGEPDNLILLNQCKECGKWVSEDDELYGSGYCPLCCTYCETSQSYVAIDEKCEICKCPLEQCIDGNIADLKEMIEKRDY